MELDTKHQNNREGEPMTRTKKIVFLFIILILFSLLLANIIANQRAVSLPFSLVLPVRYPLFSAPIVNYLFWGSLVALIILLILALIIIFWPIDAQTRLVKKDAGQLTIDKKAIDGFVNSILEQEHWIVDHSVKTRLTRNKIKVSVNGTLRPIFNAREKSSRLINRIETELHSLLGIEDKKKIQIELKDFKSGNKRNAPRVV
ncbi:hypothetical protein FC62_GL001143 [Amylolactobacillus amylotrophicus DSM 20534]|uniref:Alkaline shock response membrane anchor protein AmaP n=3 Tax=Amylolactobacillus TaxID=2767876 RepID=A0A0R1YQT4_9LACO|nr:hypothetical protein FC62_GL001143 [Amylolactobacillus amylotrophicus DSM 20534]KRM41596.1 hypothetical protein FD40_GL001438 [Amylolactobacillus amylophilus DSM 20533 = JCM 1125]